MTPLTRFTSAVMPALVAGIHVFADRKLEDVDGRDKPGHDMDEQVHLCRHARARRGHPRFCGPASWKTWMAGTSGQ
jgi:hypothetical protein